MPRRARRSLVVALACALAACEDPPAVVRDAGRDVSVVDVVDASARRDGPPEAPVVPPVGYRACREPERDPEGGFCDATALWGMHQELPPRNHGAVTIADFDGDGYLEILTVQQDGRAASLLTPDLGFWADVAGAWGLARYQSLFAATAVDLDGDGDVDLVAQREHNTAALLRNTGRAFEEVTTLGAAEHEAPVWLAWDLDGDGMLDLVQGVERKPGDCPNPFGIPGCPGYVAAWRQVAPWSFRPMPVTPVSRRVQGMRMHDWDGDGRDELLVTCDIGMVDGGDLLFEVDRTSEGFALREATEGSGFAQELYGMGMGLVDIDGDNVQEVMRTNIGHNVVSTSGAAHRDVSLELTRAAYGMVVPGQRPVFRYFDPENVRERAYGRFQEMYLDPDSPRFPTTKWAPVVFDYDADGREDVYIPAGSVDTEGLFPDPDPQAATMLRGTGGPMTDVTDALALREAANSYGAAAADLDRDGDLDLVVSHSREDGSPGSVRILRNDVRGGRLLTVVARGRGAARAGIGAWVEVRVGGRTLRRRVDGNLSLHGTVPAEVNVGLGEAAMADDVVVRFPSGNTSRRERVPAGRVVIEE